MDSGTGPSPPFADWSQPYGDYLSDYNAIPSSGFAGAGAQLRYLQYQVFPDNSYYNFLSSVKDLNGYYITSKNTASYGSPPTSGAIVWATMPITAYWYPRAFFIEYGSAGANTTAFGYTFNGGILDGSYPDQNGYPAAPVTYNNVAVTPGTTYNIVVPSGGSVSFGYYI